MVQFLSFALRGHCAVYVCTEISVLRGTCAVYVGTEICVLQGTLRSVCWY